MNRIGFISATATLAATTGGALAQGVPGGRRFVERRADFDAAAFEAAVGRSATIRQVFEAAAFRPAVLNNIKNSFNGLEFGFGYPAGQIAIALAGHGASTVYGYSDYVWQTYRIGEFFKLVDAGGKPIASNVFLKAASPVDRNADPDAMGGMFQDTSMQMLQQRGLTVLTCHTAVQEQAKALVAKGFAPASMSAPDVAADILSHLIPGALVVPSMVATIAVLQSRYNYTYISPEL